MRPLSLLVSVLSCNQNQVVLQKLQTTAQANKLRCLRGVIFGEAKKKLVNQQETCTWISFVFEKSPVFLFPTFVFFYRFLWTFQLSLASFARQQLFLVFSFEILRERLARGRPKLIPLRMPDVWSLCYDGMATCKALLWKDRIIAESIRCNVRRELIFW